MSRVLRLLLMSTAATGTLGAQQMPDLAPRRAALQRAAFLIGEWEGDASYQTPTGERRAVRQTESVQVKIGGLALLIEGTGRQFSPGQVPGAVVYNALAVLAPNDKGEFAMRSYLLDGRSGDFPVTVSDSGFAWGFDVPGGKIRYTMKLTSAGEWHEVGEFSRDQGATWMRTMEMRLKKK